MRNLFAHATPSQVVCPITFVRLAQQGIEWLASSVGSCAIARNSERSDVGQLLAGRLALGGLVQQLRILEVFRQSLQHRERLVKVDGHGDLREILADAVLDDAPQVQRVIRLLRYFCSPLFRVQLIQWRQRVAGID